MNKFNIEYFSENQLTDEEIIGIINECIQEIETLNPNNQDDLKDILEIKKDIMDTVKFSLQKDNSTILNFLLNILLETNIIKLTTFDLNELLKTVSRLKNQNLEKIIHDFVDVYDSDEKWTGHVVKRRRLLSKPKIVVRNESSSKRRKIGSNIRRK